MVKKENEKKTTTVSSKEDKIIIYHNNRCTKSRAACAILEKKKTDFEVIEYLKSPLTPAEIKTLLKKLNIKAEELLRKKEPLFLEKFASEKRTEAEWIKIMAENPILIERPIIVKGNKAVIGRPSEKVTELLKA